MAKNKFDAIAEACMTLSVSASTVEERDTFLDFARKWENMASEAKRLLVPPEGEASPAATRW
jgi:hypothetical protein